MKHYRIIYGYGKDEFITIEETELRKALIAQGTGAVVLFPGGSVSGNEIKRIIPDYQKDMGWNRDYVLTGEDYSEIGSSKMREYTEFQSNVHAQLEGRPPEQNQLSDSVKKLGAEKRVVDNP